MTVAPKLSLSIQNTTTDFRRDTLENSPGLTPAAPMRLRRLESGSRDRESVREKGSAGRFLRSRFN